MGLESPEDVKLRDLIRLLSEGASRDGTRLAALDALANRPMWLATWEPEAEGFRTLLNSSGEEALPCFTSQSELVAAAERFGWLETDGSIASHELIGQEVIRHAWTRDYAYVIVDVAAAHSVEFTREELETIMAGDAERTGRFRTSRPPPPQAGGRERSQPYTSCRPQGADEEVSTEYRMVPPATDVFRPGPDKMPTPLKSSMPSAAGAPERDSKAPLSEAPTAKHIKVESTPKRRNGEPLREVQEVRATDAKVGVAGTYGVASIIPQTARKQKPPSTRPAKEETTEFDPTNPAGRALPGLDVPRGEVLESLSDPSSIPPAPDDVLGPELEEARPSRREDDTAPIRTARPPATAKTPATASSSIHETADLLAPHDTPDDGLLQAAVRVLRTYPEVEWACYCLLQRQNSEPSPAIGLRVADNYRANVLDIVDDLVRGTRAAGRELEVVLIDGHDLLRKSREAGYVFFPWKPKPPKPSPGPSSR